MAKIRRYEKWIKDYLSNRYMEFLSEQELNERAENIFCNMMTLTNIGQLSLPSRDTKCEYWITLFTHLKTEFEHRFGPYPNGFKNINIKDAIATMPPTYPTPPKAQTAISNIKNISNNAIYKFGSYKHLKETYETGYMRIAPASYYNDPSLNKAIRDDELSLHIESRINKFIIEDKESKIETYGRVKFKLESQTNYYVHCFAAAYTNREFNDFNADSCIIINKPRNLFRKMMKAVKTQKPDFQEFASPVKYIDPLTTNPNNINIFFTKHFKYSYQNEIRTIWLPESPQQSLEPFFIEIGSMKDYAKIITI